MVDTFVFKQRHHRAACSQPDGHPENRVQIGFASQDSGLLRQQAARLCQRGGLLRKKLARLAPTACEGE